ncbi:hypothetical protein BDZ91DRAFT_768571 [Kalaharituber pfeilii]|nr:hypothetical protein BDZ91DRAFT_768571 [Kalaharituber pfeilii]
MRAGYRQSELNPREYSISQWIFSFLARQIWGGGHTADYYHINNHNDAALTYNTGKQTKGHIYEFGLFAKQLEKYRTSDTLPHAIRNSSTPTAQQPSDAFAFFGNREPRSGTIANLVQTTTGPSAFSPTPRSTCRIPRTYNPLSENPIGIDLADVGVHMGVAYSAVVQQGARFRRTVVPLFCKDAGQRAGYNALPPSPLEMSGYAPFMTTCKNQNQQQQSQCQHQENTNSSPTNTSISPSCSDSAAAATVATASATGSAASRPSPSAAPAMDKGNAKAIPASHPASHPHPHHRHNPRKCLQPSKHKYKVESVPSKGVILKRARGGLST